MGRLKNFYESLKKEFPTWDKIAFDYDDSTVRLAPDWLMQTPDIWGMKATNLPVQPWGQYGSDIDPDFRLPYCTESSNCTGNFKCEELNASVSKPGDKPKKMCLGHSDKFVDLLYNDMIRAGRSIHISTLGPGPNQRFLAKT